MILDIDEQDLKVLDIVLEHEIEQFPMDSAVAEMLKSIQLKLRKVN